MKHYITHDESHPLKKNIDFVSFNESGVKEFLYSLTDTGTISECYFLNNKDEKMVFYSEMLDIDDREEIGVIKIRDESFFIEKNIDSKILSISLESKKIIDIGSLNIEYNEINYKSGIYIFFEEMRFFLVPSAFPTFLSVVLNNDHLDNYGAEYDIASYSLN